MHRRIKFKSYFGVAEKLRYICILPVPRVRSPDAGYSVRGIDLCHSISVFPPPRDAHRVRPFCARTSAVIIKITIVSTTTVTVVNAMPTTAAPPPLLSENRSPFIYPARPAERLFPGSRHGHKSLPGLLFFIVE